MNGYSYDTPKIETAAPDSIKGFWILEDELDKLSKSEVAAINLWGMTLLGAAIGQIPSLLVTLDKSFELDWWLRIGLIAAFCICLAASVTCLIIGRHQWKSNQERVEQIKCRPVQGRRNASLPQSPLRTMLSDMYDQPSD